VSMLAGGLWVSFQSTWYPVGTVPNKVTCRVRREVQLEEYGIQGTELTMCCTRCHGEGGFGAWQ